MGGMKKGRRGGGEEKEGRSDSTGTGNSLISWPTIGRPDGRTVDGRLAPAKLGQLFVCHAYNDTGCKRDKTAKGCKNVAGQEFAHACNHRKADGNYCLQAHERSKNH